MRSDRLVSGLFSAVLVLIIWSCITTGEKFTGIPPGIWRATLHLGEGTQNPQFGDSFDEKSNAVLPFNFEVIYHTPDSFHIVILNGPERIPINDISFGLDRTTGRDTLQIEFAVYDSYLKAQYEEDAIEGEWVVRSKDNYRIPFKALHAKDYRFTDLKETPITDISGRWAVQLSTETENPDPAIGLFEQNGNMLTGTFLTEIGDYRFLEGTVQGDRIFLSAFDGAHSFLFEAKILADGTITGIFRNGSHFKTYWNAQRNTEVELTDPYKLTYLKSGYESFDFNFPTPDGKMISLSQPEFEGKVKIAQIFGTWCPNCFDESTFLVEYLNAYPTEELAIIGLAFERHSDIQKAKKTIARYADKMQITYPLVYAGPSDKEKASRALPMLNRVISYPTLIFIDKENRVRKIHTGFAGPATPEYEDFKEEFNRTVQELIAE